MFLPVSPFDLQVFSLYKYVIGAAAESAMNNFRKEKEELHEF